MPQVKEQLTQQEKESQKFTLSNIPDWLRTRFSDSQRYLILWVICGVVCGAVAVLFHLAIDRLLTTTMSFAKSLGGLNTYLFLLFAPAVGGLIGGVIVAKIEPTAAGSGIPQTKARYYRKFGVFRLREAFWRFIAGVFSVGLGMSLGREGPTVHICAAIASKIGQMFGLAKKRIQAMVPIGMGAGIAAAFNTPLAAMFFVWEELLGDISTKQLFGMLVAVVLAAIVERSVLGEHPVFDVLLPAFHTSWWMLICIPLAFTAAGLGHLFVRTLLWTRQRFKDSSLMPLWLKPAFGGLAVGLLGTSVLMLTGRSGVFGIGYWDLSDALNGRLLTLGVLALLFVGKFLATIIAYASGGSGGLFAPALFLGGIWGALLGGVGHFFLPQTFDSNVVGAVSLLGMGAFFAAVVRCPLTSWMIIFEMTRNYTLMLPLMIGNILAYLLAARLQPVALYDSLLLQDKINLKRMPSYQGEQDWRNLPIKTIMTFDVVTVRADKTPTETLAAIGETKHHAYPVVDENERVVGMMTHHEIEEFSKSRPEESLRNLLRNGDVVSVLPETSIRDVASTLVIRDVLQAPVVKPGDTAKLLGIVTLHDIARQQNAITESIGR